MTDHSYDVILVGGGVMGSAIAYYLMRYDPTLRVVLIEQDPTYSRASTSLSDGNTRVQFNLKENIQMSLYGLEVLERFADEMAVNGERPDVAFHQQGNLFIVDEAGVEEAQQAVALQQSLGCQVEWLNPEEVQQLFPLYNLEGCTGGTFGPHDGTMSPLAVLIGYRNKAIELGVTYLHAEVDAPLVERGRIAGVRLASGERLSAPAVVNSAGAWAAELASRVGVSLPISPVKREVSIIRAPVSPEKHLPAVFFPSGLYLMHERAGTFLCGKSMADDPITLEDFSWDRNRFEMRLWPELAALIPALDRLRVVSGWAGLYEVNTLDGNAILGEWPELEGFFLANGFSGHGFQQCHAVGRYLAELILDRPPTLDLSIFSPRRILENAPVFEGRHRII